MSDPADAEARAVLVVEADPATRRDLAALLQTWAYEPVTAAGAEDAIALVARQRFRLTLLDTRLPDSAALDFLRRLRSQNGAAGPVVLLSDGRDVALVREATALGAADFVRKPVDATELENVLKEVLGRPRRAPAPPGPAGPDGSEVAGRLHEEVGLWQSPKMRELQTLTQQAARVDVTVLIGGETGTGKDLVARAIHEYSSRRDRPFVKVNCAAVPRELLESELFGHERGAFTGAHQLKIGKFEAANRGTIFLDEIGDLHAALQAKLLHVLQDGTFSRVGGKSTIQVDVRVLAATNRDLERDVEQGLFRQDLFYRLNVIQIVVPPLRERTAEIPLLAEYFARRYGTLFNRKAFVLAPEALDRLSRHHYPGNIRELENVVKRMIVLDDPYLTRAGFGNGQPNGAPHAPPAAPVLSPGPALVPISLKDIARTAARAAEREAIARVLEQTRWNRVRAAKLLRISYRALLYKIKDAGLDRRGTPAPAPGGNA